MSEPRRYSDDEVRAIVDRALKAPDASAASITHDDLLALGEQIGITPEAMARAATAVDESRRESLATRVVSSRRRKLFAAHAAAYALLNGLFFAVNFFTTPGEWWFLFPAVLWGLALAAHAAFAFATGVSQRALERERSKLAPATKLRVTTPANSAMKGEAALSSEESEALPAPPRNVSRS
jgi:hypothetical protein